MARWGTLTQSNLIRYNIKSTGGTIIVESGVTQNYVELLDGSTIKGLYSSLNTAVNDASSGQTISVFNSSSLADNVSISSGITLTIKSGATLNLNGYKLLLSGGSFIVESGANFNYLAKLKNSSETLLGYYGTVQTAINDANDDYIVELQNITYSENIIFTSKEGVKLKGAGIGNTTINGNITLTNSSYTAVSNFSMGSGKSITINGGEQPNIYSISSTSGGGFLNAYGVDGIGVMDLNYIGNNAQGFAFSFYDTYTFNMISNTIKEYEFGIYATTASDIEMSGAYFCNNMLDLYASSTSWIYATQTTLSYFGAYMGPCGFGTTYECGSMAKKDELKIAKNAIEPFQSLREANLAFRTLLADEDISKSFTLTEESKNKIRAVIAKYKNTFSNDMAQSEINEALRKLSSLYNMLDEESVFVDYVSRLVSNKNVSKEMKRFLIPDIVSKGNYNDAINLIDEILTYKDIPLDLEYELLYEKGTIQKYYLKEKALSEEVFLNLYKKAGDHILGKYAKAQLENQSGLDDGNKPIKDDNLDISKDFEISSYPNPFNPTTTIAYQIPNDGFVNLIVYNTLGQVVSTLVNEHQTSGKYSVQFNANNLPSGVYFYKIESGNFIKVNKMLLLR